MQWERIMEWLIWTGAVISVIGLVGIVVCAVQVARARAREKDEAALRARLQRAVAINMAALLLSMLGLGMVVVGAILS
ncbi:hypothetical protein RM543_11965 [Roseicyclus sp. F158]|uniref:HIG1 domain-containing protein n=1 Tax=Tropicimonas omnivorans TaxID=3075590 RepID=A0ABU3DI51_9RHOB|nr:hypothetical protein [Roseicyclus sp. F158]MDT0683405.1 hypothetical protein [Roseicyclus sp. F158]